MYWSELPLVAARCGTSSMKTMSQHSRLSAAFVCTPSLTTREVWGSMRTDSGDTVNICPHDLPVDPAGRKRLSPFSTRSQSEREIVACTAASDVLVSEKLAATRSVPGSRIETSSGSTSSCAAAGRETTAPTAQRASTVRRTRPLRSAPALAGEREPEFCIRLRSSKGENDRQAVGTRSIACAREVVQPARLEENRR